MGPKTTELMAPGKSTRPIWLVVRPWTSLSMSGTRKIVPMTMENRQNPTITPLRNRAFLNSDGLMKGSEAVRMRRMKRASSPRNAARKYHALKLR